MLGAIVGDIVGSAYEYHTILDSDLPLLTPASSYTDETVLTIGVADCLLHQRAYGEALRTWAIGNPGRRYSTRFAKWIEDPDRTMPTSYGNGAAGRVSPVGWAFDTLEETLVEARRSAEPTHNHPDGIAGAQAVAAAIFLARTGASKDAIREYLEQTFGYDLQRSLIDCTGGWFEAADFRSRRRSSASLRPRTCAAASRTPWTCGVTPTRRRPSPAVLPRRSITEFQLTWLSRAWPCCRLTSAQSWTNSADGFASPESEQGY